MWNHVVSDLQHSIRVLNGTITHRIIYCISNELSFIFRGVKLKSPIPELADGHICTGTPVSLLGKPSQFPEDFPLNQSIEPHPMQYQGLEWFVFHIIPIEKSSPWGMWRSPRSLNLGQVKSFPLPLPSRWRPWSKRRASGYQRSNQRTWQPCPIWYPLLI